MPEKVLFDTDIGTDIDDAVCLAYLLAQPACDLLGITTVSGEATRRAMLASALCRAAGKDVPIHPGAEDPLLIAQKQPRAQQADALGDWPHSCTFPQGSAVEFLRQTIRAHPGEVTLLAVGPLTNVGLLFRADPEIPKLLKGLVLMCGQFFGRSPGRGPMEWNASCDPHAAAIVYQSAVAVHRSHGLDVTHQVSMPAKEVRARFQAPLLRPVAAFAEVFFEHRDEITFHDPLAAATIFDDSICTFSRGNVHVELESPRLAGYMHWQVNGGKGSHQVADTVDPDRFFAHYFSVFS
ncbi:MAG: nucleoside hydrolase [Chloroflexota bacterium]|nr:nucleoside hydrolase [Chloroflexota bacterium]MDE2839912.1 nucleoside hydrolase [Chloroflexota bacterium]MDE2931557.1 nucleoside hydrolase [Chloroflexota bacterium]